jgi:RNA polymerase sigma-70 factor (ECF subfamily)
MIAHTRRGRTSQPNRWVIRVRGVMTTVSTDYEATFRELFPRLVSLGVVMTGRRDIAHELAQETLLRAHRRWAEVSRYDAPAAWCRKVMVNLVIDHQRSAASERRAVERLAAAPTRDVDGPALAEWSRLVATLPERQRAVVSLYYADDRSVDEIAELLDVSAGTVKTTLFKARRSLARHLDAEGERHG